MLIESSLKLTVVLLICINFVQAENLIFKSYERLGKQFQNTFQQSNRLAKNDNEHGREFLRNFNLNKQLQRLFTDELNIGQDLPNITVPCALQLEELTIALQNRSTWSLQVLDAFGKPPAGILYGTFSWLGEYNECLEVTVPNSDWQSKYCLLKTLNPQLNLVYGLCAPKKCTDNDVLDLVNYALKTIEANISSILPIHFPTLNATNLSCKQEKTLDGPAIVAIVILSIIAFIVLCGTSYDIYEQHNDYFKNLVQVNRHSKSDDDETLVEKSETETVTESKEKSSNLLLDILKTFSLYTNTKKLFNVANNQDQLSCLHGIRFLSLAWVILGHTYAFCINSVDSIKVATDLYARFSFLSVSNAFFSVDSFFLLSGLLTSYLFLRELSKKQQTFSWKVMIMYYWHRFWRLTPPYMIAVMISVTLFKYLGNGPMYPDTGIDPPGCKWWANLLYINNLFNQDKQCFGVAWYLANDMQFHWIAPIVLIPIVLGKRIIGLAMAGLLLVGCFISSLAVLLANPGMENGLLNNNNVDFFDQFYIRPWTRIGPFIIGLLYGYLIHLHKLNPIRIKLSEGLNFLGWLASLALIGMLIFGLYPDVSVSNGFDPLSKTTHIFYQIFCRTAWGVALGFIIFSCVSGNGGVFNTILSWPIWIPLSRLTFSAYLIHALVIFRFYSALEKPFDLQDLTMAYFYVANVVLSYVAAYFFSMCVEVPFIGLEKIILTKRH